MGKLPVVLCPSKSSTVVGGVTSGGGAAMIVVVCHREPAGGNNGALIEGFSTALRDMMVSADLALRRGDGAAIETA